MSAYLLDPRLADCRRLFLVDHVVQVRIGVHAFEKRGAQRLMFNVDLFVPLAQSTPQADDIAEVVDYDFIRDVIARHVERAHVQLQETLCDGIAASLLEHPKVRAVRVATHKPDVYADCAAVGVEIFKFNTASS
jgi:dihydroneopterin aldolase